MRSEKDFFSEFHYPDKIVPENEGNVEVLSLRAEIFLFMDLAQRLDP